MLGKRLRKSFLYVVAIAALSTQVGTTAASAQQVVTLSEASALMRANERQFEILDLEGKVAAEAVRQAFGQRLPRASLILEYIYTQQEIVNQDNTTFQAGQSTYPTARVTLRAEQPIYDAVKFRSLPLARAEQTVIEAQAEIARVELSRLLIDSFLGVARAQFGVQQARAVLRARTQLSRDIDLLVDSGRGDFEQQLRAEGDVFAARADLASAELELTEALFELHRFTGPQVDGVRYGAGVGVADFRSFRQSFTPERLSQVNPQIEAARAQVALAERRVASVRGAYLPTARLTLDAEYEQTDGSLFGGGSTVQSADLGVELNYSIYEGGVRSSKVREAENNLEIARLRLQQAEDLSVRRYTALVDALQRSLEIVSAIANDRRVASERVEAAQERLDAGNSTLEEVLDAQLRRDSMALRGQIARVRTIQLQAELYALFGALDIATLSQDFAR